MDVGDHSIKNLMLRLRRECNLSCEYFLKYLLWKNKFFILIGIYLKLLFFLSLVCIAEWVLKVKHIQLITAADLCSKMYWVLSYNRGTIDSQMFTYRYKPEQRLLLNVENLKSQKEMESRALFWNRERERTPFLRLWQFAVGDFGCDVI